MTSRQLRKRGKKHVDSLHHRMDDKETLKYILLVGVLLTVPFVNVSLLKCASEERAVTCCAVLQSKLSGGSRPRHWDQTPESEGIA